MVRRYEAVANELSPTTVLLDMDGVLVDWDAGFRREWERYGHDPSKIDRAKSYSMEECVAPELRGAAVAVMSQPGFFRELPPLPCNPTCPQDKIEWLRKHLGHLHFPQPGNPQN